MFYQDTNLLLRLNMDEMNYHLKKKKKKKHFEFSEERNETIKRSKGRHDSR